MKEKDYSNISLEQEATAFQAEVAVLLVCVAGCLKKKPFKEQIIICLGSQIAIMALGET